MPPALRLLKWGALKVVLVLGLCGCVSEAFALRGCLRKAAARYPVGYDPRRRGRPGLPVAEDNEDSKDSQDSAMRRALCLGVWMGQSVVARIKE